MNRLKTGVVIAFLMMLSGCSSSGSSGGNNPPDPGANDQDNEGGGKIPAGNGSEIAFPELQGVWSTNCELFDADDPGDGYAMSSYTILGNSFKTDTRIFSDSNCVTLLERGFLQSGSSFQTTGVLARPGGTADTSVGAVPFIDITTQEYTIDSKPVIASLASLLPVETAYEIVYVDGNTFYLGVDSDTLDGNSPETRPQALDFELPYTKQ